MKLSRLLGAALFVAVIGSLLAVAVPRYAGAQGYSNPIPTISSGFGTSPAVTAGRNNAFRVNVGTGGTATGGVIAMNQTAPTGWNCSVADLTAFAANIGLGRDIQVSSSTTVVTVQHQTVSTGAALAYTASDILTLICSPF